MIRDEFGSVHRALSAYFGYVTNNEVELRVVRE